MDPRPVCCPYIGVVMDLGSQVKFAVLQRGSRS